MHVIWLSEKENVLFDLELNDTPTVKFLKKKKKQNWSLSINLSLDPLQSHLLQKAQLYPLKTKLLVLLQNSVMKDRVEKYKHVNWAMSMRWVTCNRWFN